MEFELSTGMKRIPNTLAKRYADVPTNGKAVAHDQPSLSLHAQVDARVANLPTGVHFESIDGMLSGEGTQCLVEMTG